MLLPDKIKPSIVALCAVAVLAACAPGVFHFLGDISDPVLAAELEQMIAEGEPETGARLVAQRMDPAVTPAGDGLAIPDRFAVTRPVDELVTDYHSYYITGTSDPASPVYFNGEEIQRLGTKGVFGVHVDLEMGANTFVFQQDGQEETVRILRVTDTTTAINEIRQSSMVPAIASTVGAGEALSVGCIAPAGAIVQATYGGVTATLVQSKRDELAGLPAAYTGRIEVGRAGYDPDETHFGGKMQYTMTYKDQVTSYTSEGDVYVVGRKATPVVEVATYAAFLYPDLGNLGWIQETVKTGARDYVTGQTNNYFQLASGYHISKEQVEVLTGDPDVAVRLEGASFLGGGKIEQFIFHGTGAPLYNTWISDNELYLRLYNTSGTPSVDVSGSGLVASWSVAFVGDTVTYSFPLKGQVWGYDVTFEGNDTVLSLRRKPVLATGDRPLEDVVVLLDPGHGGTDPGALGIAGQLGPTEADVNLANAQAIGRRLADLGAQVVLTREEDDYLSLDDRLRLIEANGADLFLSVHHNSMAESIDGNRVEGLEVYYHTPLSAGFAETMMNSLTTGLGRSYRAVERSYYRVTLLYHSPALLLELGFMQNPVEYEKAADATEMERVADAVADGILATLRA